MKPPEIKQNLRILNSDPIDLSVCLFLTPYKICVAALLHEYIYLKNTKKLENDTKFNESLKNIDESLTEGKHVFEDYINSVQMEPLQRKGFCRLLLILIQNVDMNFEELATKILGNQDGHVIHTGKNILVAIFATF